MFALNSLFLFYLWQNNSISQYSIWINTVCKDLHTWKKSFGIILYSEIYFPLPVWMQSNFLFNPTATKNVGNVPSCKPRVCWNFTYPHVTFSVLCHNIAVLVLGLDSTWKDHALALNPSFCHHKHGWKMSWSSGFRAYKCRKAVSNNCHWHGTSLPLDMKVSPYTCNENMTYCRNVNMVAII